MSDDLAGLRHDMEMALDAGDKATARLERRVEELERALEEHLRNSIEQMEKMVKFAEYVEELSNNFNAHGHEAPTGQHTMTSTGRPVKADG